MGVIWFFVLLAVARSASTTETHKEVVARHAVLQQGCPPDVHATLKEMAALLAKQKEKISALEKLNEVKQVAFSASLLTQGAQNFGPFNTFVTLVFKQVVTNIGNAYNSQTGIFIAPVRGVYHFEWYIGAHGGAHPAAASLMRNGDIIFTAWEHQASHYGTSSNGAAVLLEVGDQVYVSQWINTVIFDNYHPRHTSFSGFMLFSM